MPDLQTAFPVLTREGFGLIDAGAREGLPSIFGEIAPILRAAGFEPDPEECERLNRSAGSGKTSYLPAALGAKEGQADFHVCRSPGASSFYAPNRAWLNRFPDPGRYDVIQTRTIPMRTLDGILKEGGPEMPAHMDFLKLDVQGAELDILRGAERTLKEQVVGVEVEVEFSPLYESQPLFRDVDAFLSERGFTLFKLRRKSWVRANCQEAPQVSAGQLVAADALYLRDPLQHGWNLAGPDAAHRLEALVLAAALYDLNDFALEIAASDAMRAWIGKRSSRLDYQPNGSGRFAAWMKIAGEIRKGKPGWGNLYEWSRRRGWGRADSDKDFYTRTS